MYDNSALKRSISAANFRNNRKCETKNSFITKHQSMNQTLNSSTSQFNKSNSLYKKKRVDLIGGFSTYLKNKQKEIESMKRFRVPRPEQIKKLLNETKNEHSLMEKIIPNNSINPSDYKELNLMYKEGHKLKRDDDYDMRMTQNSLTKKYDLKPPLTSKEKYNLRLIKNKSFNPSKVEISDKQYYKSYLDSFQSLRMNKNLLERLLDGINEERIKAYLTKHFEFEEEKLKTDLMPKIKILPISRRKKNKSKSLLSQNIPKQMLTKLGDIGIVTRRDLFENYNCIYLKVISNFLTTPTSRSETQMINYMDDKTGELKLLIYGGTNITRQGDVWECLVGHSEKSGKKYRWKKISKISGETPLPRSGHTACLYRNDNVIIYGGVIEDEKTLHFKEDILIYNISERRFSSDVCSNKANVSWRKNHIAEIIGQYMLIYGGVGENGEVLNEPWALDLYRMKWVQTKFVSSHYLPKLYYHSSCQVFSPIKKYHPKFSLFKVYTKISGFNSGSYPYEGIFIFGGIKENNRCNGDLYVITRGKPLGMLRAETQGQGPCPRCQCSMSYFEKLNCVIVHGGRNEYDPSGPFFNDFYLLDTERMFWVKAEMNEVYAEPRAGHCAAIIDNEIIIFGGFNDKYFLKSDLLIGDLDIIESTNLIRRFKAKKLKKKDKEKDESVISDKTVSMIKDDKSNLKIEESPYVLINSHLQSSKSFFENFPEQKKMLRTLFDNIENSEFFKIEEDALIKDFRSDESFKRSDKFKGTFAK